MTKKLEIPGMIYGESNADYHSNKAVSRSGLKDFRTRPSLFKKKHIDHLIASNETPAMALGTAMHTIVLEPDEFEKNYEVLPHDFRGTTKAGKELMEIIRSEGKIALKHDVYSDLVDLRESVFSNPIAKALLSQGYPEITWRLSGELYDTQCRTDWFNPCAGPFDIVDDLLPSEGEPYACDLKTTQCLDDWISNGYNNTIAKFGYDEQCTFYKAVMNRILKAAGHYPVEKFYFIVVEKQEPRETAVFLIELSTLNDAYGRVLDDLNRLNECFRTGNFPGFAQNVIVTEVSSRVRESEYADSQARINMLEQA